MIDLLQGELAARRSDHVVILCSGVGYRAAVSAETLRALPSCGQQVTLHTHLIAREDALTLYGFHTPRERELFLMLLTVQAVGPKVALAVLSVTPPQELVATLAAGDADRLRTVPGIGKRTAERIVVELREKVDAGAAGSGAGARTPIVARRGEAGSPRALARAGLLELGYGPEEADGLLGDAPDGSAEELIGHALRLARSGA
jgi:Holliday junction DNA helicase RuvA